MSQEQALSPEDVPLGGSMTDADDPPRSKATHGGRFLRRSTEGSPTKQKHQRKDGVPQQRTVRDPSEKRPPKVGPALARFAKDSLVDLTPAVGLICLLVVLVIKLAPGKMTFQPLYLAEGLLVGLVLTCLFAATLRTYSLSTDGKGFALMLVYILLFVGLVIGLFVRVPHLVKPAAWAIMLIMVLPGPVSKLHKSFVAKKHQHEIDMKNNEKTAQIKADADKAAQYRQQAEQLLNQASELLTQTHVAHSDAASVTGALHGEGGLTAYIHDLVESARQEERQLQAQHHAAAKQEMAANFQRQVNEFGMTANQQIQQLQSVVTDKDRKIAELRAQLGQKPVPPVTIPGQAVHA